MTDEVKDNVTEPVTPVNRKNGTVAIIARFAGFWAVFALILGLLSLIYSSNKDPNIYDSFTSFVKERELRNVEDESLQVLFMGDSECYSSFHPKCFSEAGISSFNLGTSAQKICDSYVILKDTLEKQSPDVVILETNLLFHDQKKDSTSGDIVLNKLNSEIPVFKFHSDWKILVGELVPFVMDKVHDTNNGFIVRETVIPYEGGPHMNYTPETLHLKDSVCEYLEMINDMCLENDIKFILVSSPSAINYDYTKHNGIAEWADANGVEYLDLNLIDEIGIDWSTDTKDAGDHINLSGAIKVSNYLAGYVKQYID